MAVSVAVKEYVLLFVSELSVLVLSVGVCEFFCNGGKPASDSSVSAI